jgi:3'-5' exoribonuclease 1
MNKRLNKKQRKIEQAVRAMPAGRLILFDLEATCWEPEQPERQEIIEIGAVALDGVGTLARCGGDPEFSALVRPTATPRLSDFCTGLTSIRQADVDDANPFPAVFAQFIAWAGGSPFWLGSWGTFDRAILAVELDCHSAAMPRSFAGHIDLRREFARWKRVRPPGLHAAMASVGLSWEGEPHRALNDARNLARLARMLLEERAPARTVIRE